MANGGATAGTLGIDAEFARAVSFLQAGRQEAAAVLCREIIRLRPRHAEALHVLGLAELQNGQTVAGIDFIRRSLEVNPAQPHAHCNLGNAYRDMQQPAEALLCYRRALTLTPDFAGALYSEGNALVDLDRPAEALTSFDRAVALQPNYAEAHQNRGNVLLALGRPEQALDSYRRALTLMPGSSEVLGNCAVALRLLQRHEEALAIYDRLAAKQPNDIESLMRRSDSLMQLDRPQAALAGFDQLLGLQPDSVQALDGRGLALRALKRYSEALDAFERALLRRPDSVDILYRRAVTLRNLKRHAESATAFSRVVDLAPEYDYALGNLLHERLQNCDWTGYAETLQKVERAVLQGKRAYLPGPFLSVSNSAAAQLQCASSFVAGQGLTAARPAKRAYRHERIRVAYVSADFREHPVSNLLAGVFEQHDRRRFEIFAISLQPEDASAIGRRVKAAFDGFIDVTQYGDREVAALLLEKEIDIAVDLMGFSGGSRPPIFARRAAPVQVNYLGYSGTLGAPYMDYILADRIVVPEASEAFYAEKVVCLPDSFQPNDSKREIAQQTPTRAQCGLPERGIRVLLLQHALQDRAGDFRMLDAAAARCRGQRLVAAGGR